MSTLPNQLLTSTNGKNGLTDPSTVLTISQASKYIGVNPVTLRRWEKSGLLSPLYTKGGKRRYTPDHIHKLKLRLLTPVIPTHTLEVIDTLTSTKEPLTSIVIAFTLVSAVLYLGFTSHVYYQAVQQGYAYISKPQTSFVLGASDEKIPRPNQLKVFYAAFLRQLPNPLLLLTQP